MEIKLINGVLKKINRFEKSSILKQFLICYFLGGAYMFLSTLLIDGISFRMLLDVFIGGLFPGVFVSGLAIQLLKVASKFIKENNIFLIGIGIIFLYFFMKNWVKYVVH